MLIFGDNLQVMKSLLRNEERPANSAMMTELPECGSIDIDPPFATKQDFRRKQTSKRHIRTRLLEHSLMEFMRKRFVLLHTAIAQTTGALYVHLDNRRRCTTLKVIRDEMLR